MNAFFIKVGMSLQVPQVESYDICLGVMLTKGRLVIVNLDYQNLTVF